MHAQRIETRMLEEALIFGRNNRVDQHLGQIGETDQPALLRDRSNRFVISSGSTRYWVRSVLSRSEITCATLLFLNLTTASSSLKYDSAPGKISIASGRMLYQPMRLVVFVSE